MRERLGLAAKFEIRPLPLVCRVDLLGAGNLPGWLIQQASFAQKAQKGIQHQAGSKADIWGANYIKPSPISSNVLAEPYKGSKKSLPIWSYVSPSGWKIIWSRWKDSFKSMYSLSKLKKNTKAFNLREFKMEVLTLYKETCFALAAGDKSRLRQLATPAIYSDMKRQISTRQASGWDKVEWNMQDEPPLYDVELVQARIIAADPKDDSTGFVQMTVKIPSKQTFVARDKKGKIVSGDAASVLDVVDHWVFEIPLSSKVQQRWRVAGRLSITE